MPTYALKRLLIGLLLVTACLHAENDATGDGREAGAGQPAPGAPAGETSPPGKADQGQSDQGRSQSKEPEPAPEESFTPSEKISEDLSVSFPVDI